MTRSGHTRDRRRAGHIGHRAWTGADSLRVVPTELTYETKGDVGIITLQRPEARNALTFTTYRELEEAVRSSTARCLIITGADPAFCSGDDVRQVMVKAGSDTAERLSTEPRLTPAADALLHSDIPVV